MSWYRTGTVSVTNSSPAVVGTGTSWLTAVGVGWGFVGPDGRVYEIQSVNSDVSLTLARNYSGVTLAGQQYDAYPTQSEIQVLAAEVASLIADYAVVRDTVGSGQFPSGSAPAPAVSFASDVDTGFYRYTSNSIGVATGGQMRHVFDGAGNIGAGLAPGSWTASAKAIEFPYPAMGMDGAGQAFFSFNLIETSDGVYAYKSNNPGVLMRTVAGGMAWLTAPAGTIGAAATPTERMRLSSDGGLNIATGGSGQKLEVGGGFKISGAATLPTSLAAGLMSYEGPHMRSYVGDGTGYSWRFTKRVASTNTDLVLVLDDGNFIQTAPTAPPALTVNGHMVFNLTSNTNLRVSVRGTDGVTRVVDITLT